MIKRANFSLSKQGNKNVNFEFWGFFCGGGGEMGVVVVN